MVVSSFVGMKAEETSRARLQVVKEGCEYSIVCLGRWFVVKKGCGHSFTEALEGP